ncbi:MAG: ABC transporter permease [Isosphaeraceae bacterium]
MAARSPLLELYKARLREFYRQPARLFWVYFFPTILAVVLGMAFSNGKAEPVFVDLIDNESAGPVKEALDSTAAREGESGRPGVRFAARPADEAMKRLLTGKAALVVEPNPSGPPTYHYDTTRPEAGIARTVVDDALQRAWGRYDVDGKGQTISSRPPDRTQTERGSRYIDFLIPGLIGLNTMGGGMWGVGFLIVNYRVGKLLKRFMATPMPRHDFLLAILGARLTFLLPDVGILLLLGILAFQMPVRGNLALFGLVEIVGALAFSGLGLLIACRTKTTETVSGLMNFVMMPMWLCSGVFFPSDRFPALIQPVIQALPLTQLVAANRMILLEDAGLLQVAPALAILAAWSVVTFLLALRWFRWS